MHAENIEVSACDGVITLSGSVPIFAEKLSAEIAVQRVEGVKAIAEELEVTLLELTNDLIPRFAPLCRRVFKVARLDPRIHPSPRRRRLGNAQRRGHVGFSKTRSRRGRPLFKRESEVFPIISPSEA